MTTHEGPIEWPHLELFSATPMFNTKAVVQQTGIAAPTLRAWERRYDLLSPERANNDYRLYSERDIVLIRWLKERIDTGMAISQAVALFHHLHQEQQRRTLLSTSQQQLNEAPGYTPNFEVTTASPIPSLAPPIPLFQREVSPESSQIHPVHTKNPYTSTNYAVIHNMSLVREHLIEAFRQLDEPAATMLMGSMLTIYSVEQVCTELITPTLWQIGQLWAGGQITVSVEHFASNFFRALLTNLFHVTPGSRDSPLAIVCCAPGEPHELAALMLALFLRRQHTRVAYLGQSIEISGLLHTIKELSPALICISLTMPEYLAALANLAAQVQQIPAPRPIFSFGGQVFAHYAHTIPQIAGVHLNGDLQDIVAQLYRMLTESSEKTNNV